MSAIDLPDHQLRALRETFASLDIRHLQKMSDDTGILQHANYSVPNRNEGYCVDDNARALIVACQAYHLPGCDDLRRLATIYLAFLSHAYYEPLHRFRNFMSYERRWLEPAGSEDSQGRALWALGIASGSAPLDSERTLAGSIFESGFGIVQQFSSPRAGAYALLGADAWCSAHGATSEVLSVISALAERVYRQFKGVATRDWEWCEDYLTYDNAVLPWGLLLASARLANTDMRDMALTALRWLMKVQTSPATGRLSLVGNNGWWTRGGPRAQFDQQPLDAAALVMACGAAWKLTSDSTWLDDMVRAYQWFDGENDSNLPLADPSTGGSFDGLGAHAVNQNRGAESSVMWLLAQCSVGALIGRISAATAGNGVAATVA